MRFFEFPAAVLSQVQLKGEGSNPRDNDGSPTEAAKRRRSWELDKIASEYCHHSLISSPTGREGVLNDNEDKRFKLVQAHALFRHGDRTSESLVLRYLPPNDIECGMIDGSMEWRKLRSIKLKPHPPKANVLNGKLRLFRGYLSQVCRKGQLTFAGFQQQSSLGSYFYSRYKDLIGDGGERVFIQSTDMPRTIQSSAGFLVGFHSGKKKVPRHATIHVSRGILLGAPPPKVHRYYPYCENLFAIRKSEHALSSYFKETKRNTTMTAKRILKTLNINERISSSITEVYDSFWPILCHDKPNPCFANVCLNDSILLEGARAAHLQYSVKHSSNFSVVASQPYLYHTVLNSMDLAILGLSKGSSGRKYMQMSLSFGHDSNIAPLLSSIGLKLDHWPSYASRVVMELWQDTSKSPPTPYDYYIRVLFNGKPMNEKLPFHEENQFAAGKQLLKYDTWKTYLTTGPYREITSYVRHCRTKAP